MPGVGPTSPADHDYRPGFAAELMLKDLGLGQQAAAAADAATPLGAHAAALYAAFVAEGRGRDFSAMLPWLARADRGAPDVRSRDCPPRGVADGRQQDRRDEREWACGRRNRRAFSAAPPAARSPSSTAVGRDGRRAGMGIATVDLLRFVLALDPGLRRQVMLAGALYVGGALGVELWGASYASVHGLDNVGFMLIATVEETLEMLGQIVLAHALMQSLARPDGRIGFEIDRPALSPPPVPHRT